MSNIFQNCCDRFTEEEKKLCIFSAEEGSNMKWRRLVEAYGHNILQV
jgi:hypothetical protein